MTAHSMYFLMVDTAPECCSIDNTDGNSTLSMTFFLTNFSRSNTYRDSWTFKTGGSFVSLGARSASCLQLHLEQKYWLSPLNSSIEVYWFRQNCKSVSTSFPYGISHPDIFCRFAGLQFPSSCSFSFSSSLPASVGFRIGRLISIKPSCRDEMLLQARHLVSYVVVPWKILWRRVARFFPSAVPSSHCWNDSPIRSKSNRANSLGSCCSSCSRPRADENSMVVNFLSLPKSIRARRR
mmetsp:Transcript_27556/g.66226  ORF Transcript_27556/g.66226 Transcript_27556/m.66226 type:complete len:237 (+) Transcript_27556:3541-4251(+)